MTKAVAIASNIPTPITITINETFPNMTHKVRLATKLRRSPLLFGCPVKVRASKPGMGGGPVLIGTITLFRCWLAAPIN
jgi:hypothetical protein